MFLESSNELFKYLTKKEYIKEGYSLIDDLFILSLDKVKESDIKVFLYCPNMITSDECKSIISYYSSKCLTYEINQKIYNRLANKDNTQGVILISKPKAFNSEKLCESPLILVLDGLEQQGNIGTIFRTSEAVNVDLIIFTNLKAKVPSDLLVKASRGMIYYVPYLIIENTEETIKFLRNINSRIIVCEPEQGIDFKEFNYSGSIALIVGNERFGVDKKWFETNSEYLKIPMNGVMDSLNVGVAASLIIYEAFYKRSLK